MMIGTVVNASAIFTGSMIGGFLKKGLKEEYQDGLFTAMGLAAMGIGINNIVQNMPKSEYPVLFIVSLAIGSFIGMLLKLDTRFMKFSSRFSSNLGQGLSTAILLFCMGTLSILGPIESAINGNNTFLFTNASLDFVTSIVLSSTYGFGIAISSVILLFWQGGIYLCANLLSGFVTPPLLAEISIIGGTLIVSMSLTVLKLKDCKTMNMLPSLLVPIVWFIIIGFFK